MTTSIVKDEERKIRVRERAPRHEVIGLRPHGVSPRGFCQYEVSFRVTKDVVGCFWRMVAEGEYTSIEERYWRVVKPLLAEVEASGALSDGPDEWEVVSTLEMISLTPDYGVTLAEAQEAQRLAGYRPATLFEMLAMGLQHGYVQRFHSLTSVLELPNPDPLASGDNMICVPYLYGSPGMELGDTVKGRRCLGMAHGCVTYVTKDLGYGSTKRRFLAVYDPEAALNAVPASRVEVFLPRGMRALPSASREASQWMGELPVVEGIVVEPARLALCQ